MSITHAVHSKPHQRVRNAVIIGVLTALSFFPYTAGTQDAGQVTAFVNVTVVSMQSEQLLQDHTVVICGDSILAVGPSGQIAVPPGAVVIDGTDRYLAPGLIDAHTHVETEAFAAALQIPLAEPVPFERVLLPYLAHGVTSIRVLSGAPDLLAARDEIRAGTISGPAMMVASPMLDGMPPVLPPPLTDIVETAERARQAVRTYSDEGYDLIKIRNGLTREVYDAIIDEARSLSIHVDGHIPRGEGMTIRHALTDGQQGIAHLEEYFYAAQPADSANAACFAEWTAAGGAYVTTTLVVFGSIIGQLQDLDSVLMQPEIAEMYPFVVDVFWRRPGNPYVSGNTMDVSMLRAGLKFQQQLLHALVGAGVPVVAGSDALNPAILPGKGLWQELQAIEAAGFSAYDAMQMATVQPAELFPQFARRGLVIPGYRADLILLGKNPLETTAHLSSLEGVMTAGRWHTIDALRSRIRAHAVD